MFVLWDYMFLFKSDRNRVNDKNLHSSVAGSYPEADEPVAPDNSPANDPFSSFLFPWLFPCFVESAIFFQK